MNIPEEINVREGELGNAVLYERKKRMQDTPLLKRYFFEFRIGFYQIQAP